MRITILSFLLIAMCFVVSCGKSEKCTATGPDPNCICPAVYEPVCGCDGITYGNSCNAACSGVPSYTEGECN